LELSLEFGSIESPCLAERALKNYRFSKNS
jgi:hypothetical protein